MFFFAHFSMLTSFRNLLNNEQKIESSVVILIEKIAVPLRLLSKIKYNDLPDSGHTLFLFRASLHFLSPLISLRDTCASHSHLRLRARALEGANEA